MVNAAMLTNAKTGNCYDIMQQAKAHYFLHIWTQQLWLYFYPTS